MMQVKSKKLLTVAMVAPLSKTIERLNMNWLKHLNVEQVVAAFAAVGTGGFGAFKLVQRFSLGGHIRRIFNIEPGMEVLKEAMDNMNQVVMSQGQSIDWLTNQLTQYREELTEAREKLKEMEELHTTNITLKLRISELESQVKALEEELARRKKFTPKAKRIDEETK